MGGLGLRGSVHGVVDYTGGGGSVVYQWVVFGWAGDIAATVVVRGFFWGCCFFCFTYLLTFYLPSIDLLEITLSERLFVCGCLDCMATCLFT